jgi:hypothetical protein
MSVRPDGRGTSRIVLDHVVKNSDNRGKYAIGSERKTGGADVHLSFDTTTPISRGNVGRFKITTHKDRHGHLKRGHVADLELRSDPTTHAIEDDDTESVAFFCPECVDELRRDGGYR